MSIGEATSRSRQKLISERKAPLVAGYCRVSTDEQAREGVSLAAQAESIRAFAKSQGWPVPEIYSDEFTGTTMNRPEFNRMLADIEAGRVNTVLVYKLDRLARRQRLILSTLEDIFDQHGVTFKSVTEPFETGSAMGKAFIGMLAVFAQLERDTISERTRDALAHKRQVGQHCGRVPFGYILSTDGELTPHPENAKMLSKVKRLHRSGKSVRAIALVCELPKSTVGDIVHARR